MTDNLTRLRKTLAEERLGGFILPVNDEFMGEYVPDAAKRLTWLTGFTGSAGMAVVLAEKAAFFTDGRYTLQAKAEVAPGFELYNSSEVTPESWIHEHTLNGAFLGYDPMLHTLASIRRYEQATRFVTWKPVQPNPIDALWENRPAAPATPVRIQPERYAGERSVEKRRRIGRMVEAKGCEAVILTAPDSICWLLNIRGNDVPFTPFVLCYAILLKDGTMGVYLDEARVSPEVKAHLGDVRIHPLKMLAENLKRTGGSFILYDPATSPAWFYQRMFEVAARVVEASDPCLLPKACKNEAELAGMKAAHLRDGLAVTKFLCWLDGALAGKQKLSEMDVAARLEAFRKESPLYLEPSFTTISGSGPNGAIVHYRVTEATNRPLDSNSLLLLDSGGQYADGTTDITRTVALGKPCAEMKERFTLVLKGHIALAGAVFPKGTSGAQLDALARRYLWQAGLDYDHGTGHGVGSYLSVHEGPQGISKRANGVALAPGMILSNEPGYYKAGEYGIRIENLVVVKEVEAGGVKCLGFETITLAPIDLRVVNSALLNKQEKEWLVAYNKRVYDAHAEQLSKAERKWLKRAIG